MNLVTLDHVTHQYSERVLLDDVSLLINDRERIGLIGINGSGKTTLLRLIAGLETPDLGSVVVRGGAHPISAPGTAARRRAHRPRPTLSQQFPDHAPVARLRGGQRGAAPHPRR